MPYKLVWEEKGIYWKYFGKISGLYGREIIRCSQLNKVSFVIKPFVAKDGKILYSFHLFFSR